MEDESIALKLAIRIRNLRRKYNYTQQKLSEIADIDYKHIQLIESKKPPYVKLDTLEKLAKAFNIKPSKLLEF